jgi:hypothetical protein
MGSAHTYRLLAFKCLVGLATLALMTETVSSKFYEFGRRPVYKQQGVPHLVKYHHVYLDKRFSNKDFVHVEPWIPETRPLFAPAFGITPESRFLPSQYLTLHFLRSPPAPVAGC